MALTCTTCGRYLAICNCIPAPWVEVDVVDLTDESLNRVEQLRQKEPRHRQRHNANVADPNGFRDEWIKMMADGDDREGL